MLHYGEINNMMQLPVLNHKKSISGAYLMLLKREFRQFTIIHVYMVCMRIKRLKPNNTYNMLCVFTPRVLHHITPYATRNIFFTEKLTLLSIN